MASNALRPRRSAHGGERHPRTFRDEDTIRGHPIITHGGSQVNVIPADVRLETYVRGRNRRGHPRRAEEGGPRVQAGALALGARVEIETLPGYMPMACDQTMARFYGGPTPPNSWRRALPPHRHRTGSTGHGRPQHGHADLHPYVVARSAAATAPDYRSSIRSSRTSERQALGRPWRWTMLADGAAGAREWC